MGGAESKFAGSIPEFYDRHLGPFLFEPWAAELARRLDPAGGDAPRVLELAAGTGILTRELRMRLPSAARIVATDLNDGMLDIARSRLADLSGIEYRQADATSLPFEAGSFDAVVCQFGVMFFPDKPAAMAEAFRALRPGGQLLFNS